VHGHGSELLLLIFWHTHAQDGRARFSAVPDPEDLAAFYSASPIAHVGSVKAPTLLLLGARDRRVPLDDGHRYADALRARGMPVRVMVFPEDAHGLDKPQTEFEQWLNIAWWFAQHGGGGAVGASN
jgi:acylaminoacyl-peptidase